MHTLLHTQYLAATQADLQRGQAGRDVQRTLRPNAPPGRLRPFLAHALGAAAVRVDGDTARRAVA